MTMLSMNQHIRTIVYQCVSYPDIGFELCHYQHSHLVLESVLLPYHVPIYLLLIDLLYLLLMNYVIIMHNKLLILF